MDCFHSKPRIQALSLINKWCTTFPHSFYGLKLLQVHICSPRMQPSTQQGRGLWTNGLRGRHSLWHSSWGNLELKHATMQRKQNPGWSGGAQFPLRPHWLMPEKLRPLHWLTSCFLPIASIMHSTKCHLHHQKGLCCMWNAVWNGWKYSREVVRGCLTSQVLKRSVLKIISNKMISKVTGNSNHS